MTDRTNDRRPTIQRPLDQQTDRKGHGEVTLPIDNYFEEPGKRGSPPVDVGIILIHST